jgi:sporulation protein YlmC with PRC-barrel domain
MRLEVGKPVTGSDGNLGKLADVVIDAGTKRVTHVVVEPKDNPSAARLVPIELTKGGGAEISLECTAEAFEKLEPVREYADLRPGQSLKKDPKWDVGVEDIATTPQYGAYGEYAGGLDPNVAVTYDRVPKGEIELRRASVVYSADGHHVGSVEGVVVGGDRRITHLLLQRGHLWWKQELAVPAAKVAKLETDLVTLAVAKREAEAFPPVGT